MPASDLHETCTIFILLSGIGGHLSPRKRASAFMDFRGGRRITNDTAGSGRGNVMCKQKTPTLADWLSMLARLMPIITVYLWPIVFRFILGTAFFIAFAALLYQLLDVELSLSVQGSPL
ncbi:hypothetical protein [Rhizobium sp. 60-20]|jgi:hypothetical protein|nr:hypothetical protein [Rhizobium sp. 60-20]OJY78904.1 MAG: hypothetical protein BGP09_23630 [Rhizobium sp. 60-20]